MVVETFVRPGTKFEDSWFGEITNVETKVAYKTKTIQIYSS